MVRNFILYSVIIFSYKLFFFFLFAVEGCHLIYRWLIQATETSDVVAIKTTIQESMATAMAIKYNLI